VETVPTMQALNVYAMENYGIGKKSALKAKDASVSQRQHRLKVAYESNGLRRVVEGVLLVHLHGHPHVLLLKENSVCRVQDNAAGPVATPADASQGPPNGTAASGVATVYTMPGGKIKSGEGEADGLARKLKHKLGPETQMLDFDFEVRPDLVLATYYRTHHFASTYYPYLPPHVSNAKEQRRLYVIPLPEKCSLAVPDDKKLMAVPLFELYQNPQKYGRVLASVPDLLSRFRLNLV